VFTCIALLFAWPPLGLMVLDVDEDTVMVSEMVAVTAFLLAVDLFWWGRLLFGGYASDAAGGRGPLLEFKFWQSLALVGVLAGFWLFGPLTDGSSELVLLWPAMALGPIAILFARMMMGFAGWRR
jgi:hypothetical protein